MKQSRSDFPKFTQESVTELGCLVACSSNSVLMTTPLVYPCIPGGFGVKHINDQIVLLLFYLVISLLGIS